MTRALVLLAALAAAALGAVAAADVLSTATNQCDNIAGTCIRIRQRWAVAGIRAGCVLSAVVPLVAAWWWLTRRRAPALALGLIAVCLAFPIAVLATDPLPHLNDRWHGWLS